MMISKLETLIRRKPIILLVVKVWGDPVSQKMQGLNPLCKKKKSIHK